MKSLIFFFFYFPHSSTTKRMKFLQTLARLVSPPITRLKSTKKKKKNCKFLDQGWNVYWRDFIKRFPAPPELGQDQPGEEQQRDPEKNFRQELILLVLRRSLLLRVPRRRPHVVEVKAGSEESEREGSDAEGQVEAAVAAERLEPIESTLRIGLGSLALWTWRDLRSRILLLLTVPAVQRNHFFFGNRRLADGAQLAGRTRLQPSV